MTEHIPLKTSQVRLVKTVPFYYQSKQGEFVLYKKKDDQMDNDRASNTKHPQLFILKQDKDNALTELTRALNMELARKVAAGGLVQVKEALCNIVHEALTPNQEKAMESLPETIEILLGAYGKDHGAMEYLYQIAGNSSVMEEHTVNVTALVLQYCFFHDFSESDAFRLALCALLHDVGTSKLDRDLIESDKPLTEKEFKLFTTHSQMGHDMIILNREFDVSVARVALEHHERIDGSGYPGNSKNISPDSQLIGLIDSYEPLTYRDKNFRKAKKPFDSLQLIKNEVIEGKFSKEIFKNFTSCLIK
jgi:HD-GYP domain-containing protein (c-di-GMP phosphodiesterase class II)